MNLKRLFSRSPAAVPAPVAPDDPGASIEPTDDALSILTGVYHHGAPKPPDVDHRRRRLAIGAAAFVVLALATTLLVAAIRGWGTPEPALARGLAQFSEGDHVRAIHTFTRMLRECETDLAARYHLGAAYHNYGLHDEALDQYDKTLRLAIAYTTRAAHSAARIHAMRANYEQSIALFNLALQFDPQSPEIRAERDALIAALQPASSTTPAPAPTPPDSDEPAPVAIDSIP